MNKSFNTLKSSEREEKPNNPKRHLYKRIFRYKITIGKFHRKTKNSFQKNLHRFRSQGRRKIIKSHYD